MVTANLAARNHAIIERSLRHVEFAGMDPALWRPLGAKAGVVLDSAPIIWSTHRGRNVDPNCHLIPARIDQDACVQARWPMERMRQGCSMSSFQASQQWARMSS